MTGKRGLLWLVAGVALALLAGRLVAGLYADWAFHRAHGADALWRAAMLTSGGVRVLCFAAAFAFVFANLFAVRQSIVSLVLPRRLGNMDFSETVPPRRLTMVALIASCIAGALFAAVDPDWTVVSLAFDGSRFAEMDPYFERDLGFYVHWLPFERWLSSVATVLVAMTTVLVVVLYWSTPSVRWDERGLYVSTWVRRHLGILGGVVIALVGWDWRLDRFGLLREGSGWPAFADMVQPFSSFDHRILAPYLIMLAFGAVPIAVVFAWSVWRGYVRVALGLISLLVLAGPVTRVALPAALRPGADAAPARERPYLASRALYTRRAYGIDQVMRAEVATSGLTNAQAARWVSSWDPAAVTRHLELERRGTDVAAFGWQGGASGLDAILLRAAAPESPPGARWPADRLTAHAVDTRGAPVPSAQTLAAGLGGILIEPGAGRYALVADTIGRLAAPPFEGAFERVMQAWDQQNPRLLAVEPPNPRPRLVTHRDVRDRVRRLAPFFRAGPTVTPLVRGDSLYWVVELFSVARDYPLAERHDFDGERFHYVRHAATAVVQAQSGRVVLLPAPVVDSLTGSWLRRFPGLFTDRARAPAWMANALPPITDLLIVQGAIAGRSGFGGDTVSVRELARIDDADADLLGGPVTLMQLDSTGLPGWSAPIESASGEVVGMLTGRGGLAPRTEYLVLPPVVTWTGVLEQLQEAADRAGIGRALPHSRRGRVQTIPGANGPLYTQSFYEWPPDGPPRLAGVVVLSGTRTSVGRSLAEALGQRDPLVTPRLPAEAFRERVERLYDAMAAALRAGDWRAYGDAWATLGRLLGKP